MPSDKIDDVLAKAIVDPTKNVEDLVRALEITLEKLRFADAKRADDLRTADKEMLQALYTQKDRYDRQIFDIQTVQVKTTSDLISAQLSKETASLANQINAATVQNQGLISTLSERIGKLEQARWEVTGRASVQDPATADALREMAMSVRELSESRSEKKGTGMGQDRLIGYIIAALTIGFAAATYFTRTVGH